MIDDVGSLGANAVRVFGNTHVVTSGQISQQTYLDRWRQLLDYTKSKNMHVLPCGGDLTHWGAATTRAAAESLYSAWAQALASYDHIVGVDISNEVSDYATRDPSERVYNQPEPWFETVKRLGELTRRVSEKPITHSRSVQHVSRWVSGCIYTDTISDFLSIHCYYTPAATDADRLLASPWGSGKDLVLGEFGADITQMTPEDRTSRYQAVSQLISHSTRHAGGLAWSGYDLTDAGDYGLFDLQRREHADITTAFRSFPLSR